MEGGTISGNIASFGGGICLPIANANIITSEGKTATITGNTATTGGGVALIGASSDKKSVLRVGGNVDISGNKSGSKANDVYFSTKYDRINVIKDLSGSNIGIVMNTPGVFTGDNSVTATNYISNFFSDDTAYSVLPEGNELKLGKTFKVTFVDGYSEDPLLKEEVVEEGKAATAPDDPTREGYSFDGWEPSDFSNITGDLVVTAQWHKHKLTRIAARAATCTAAGNIEYYTCSECSKLFKDAQASTEIKKADTVIKALNHKYGAWKKLNATQHQRVCQHDKSHVQKANHSWDKGKVTRKATVNGTGIRTYSWTKTGLKKKIP